MENELFVMETQSQGSCQHVCFGDQIPVYRITQLSLSPLPPVHSCSVPYQGLDAGSGAEAGV